MNVGDCYKGSAMTPDKMKLTDNDIEIIDGHVYLLDKLNQKKIKVVLVATDLLDKLYADANKLMDIQAILNKESEHKKLYEEILHKDWISR